MLYVKGNNECTHCLTDNSIYAMLYVRLVFQI